MRVLIFGDSITQGFWDTEGGWVQRLRKQYDTHAITDLDSPYTTLFNLGISGNNSEDLIQRLKMEIEARSKGPDETAIVFATGANDSSIENGKTKISLEGFEKNLRTIIAIAKQYTPHLMFVGLSSCDETLTTPVSWIDIYYTNANLRQFDATIKRVCLEVNIAYVPIFEAFQARQSQSNLLQDGLHPNNDGHALIAGLVRPELEKLVKH